MTKNYISTIFRGRNLLIFLSLLFLLFNFGCDRKDSTSTPSETSKAQVSQKAFRFAVATWVNHGPFYLAKEKGFYENYGLKVDIQKIDDIVAQKLALQAGKLDGTISSVDFFATAAAEGVKAKTIMKLGAGDGADAIVAGENIKSVAELKGKTIAVEQGGPDHFLLLFVLEENGMTSKDVKPVYMTTGDAGAAYVAGAVDACVVWEPWVSNAISKRKSNILATSRDRSGVLVDTFVVRNDVLESRKADVVAFIKGWFEAIEYWKAHPDESNQIMAKGLGISVDDFVAMLGGVKLSDYQDNLAYFGTEQHPGQYWQVFAAANQIYQHEGIITTPANPKSATDISLLFNLYN